MLYNKNIVDEGGLSGSAVWKKIDPRFATCTSDICPCRCIFWAPDCGLQMLSTKERTEAQRDQEGLII